MKTKERLLDYFYLRDDLTACDNRDFSRLFEYLDKEELRLLTHLNWAETFKIEEHKKTKEYNYENILDDLKGDLEFAFEKALNQRGLSASDMYFVIRMYMWILDDQEMLDFADRKDSYKYYGLPFLRKVAIKYNLENPIGDKHGNEEEFN